jgi:hypothetical protein
VAIAFGEPIFTEAQMAREFQTYGKGALRCHFIDESGISR